MVFQANVKASVSKGDLALNAELPDVFVDVGHMRSVSLPVRWLAEIDLLNAAAGETFFLNFITDALREALHADVAFIHSSRLSRLIYGKVISKTDDWQHSGDTETKTKMAREDIDTNEDESKIASQQVDTGFLNGILRFLGYAGDKNENPDHDVSDDDESENDNTSDSGTETRDFREDSSDKAPKARQLHLKDLFDMFYGTTVLTPFRVSAVELVTLVVENLISISNPKLEETLRFFHSSGIEVIYHGTTTGRPKIDTRDVDEIGEEAVAPDASVEYYKNLGTLEKTERNKSEAGKEGTVQAAVGVKYVGVVEAPGGEELAHRKLADFSRRHSPILDTLLQRGASGSITAAENAGSGKAV